MVQIELYISQIQWVSPMERVRYYLRDIKHVLFSYFIKDYEPQEELQEEEPAKIEPEPKTKLSKREQIEKDCAFLGIKPPSGKDN